MPFELCKGWKSSLRHLHIWSCPTQVRVYNPQEKKLNPRTMSGYFIGYAEKFKGYKFYCPNYTSRFIESRNAKFLEMDVVSRSDQLKTLVFEEDHVLDTISTSSNTLVVHPDRMDIEELIIQAPCLIENALKPPLVEQLVDQQFPQKVVDSTLRGSTKEFDYDVSVKSDLETFTRAMESDKSKFWYDAMKDKMGSMTNNQVWDLVELPNGVKPICCKWVFKTKKDSLSNIERYKARLVAKGFSQKEEIDYQETFSLILEKDSFCIIMALVAHFDLDLHQMDAKTAFLNGDLKEEVCMKQPEGFISNKENTMDQCIYHKVSGSKIIFLVLYVDDNLLATNDMGLLHEIKQFVSQHLT
ncbi:Reverse transcriptase [Theobroma cacao]|nr:Reverse transcriptase [Theobroma cacao]